MKLIGLSLLSTRSALIALGCASVQLSTTASAQTTFVVDDDGGPGVDFTEIQPALDAAGPVDVIEVREGVYPAFTMGSPTRLLGDPGAQVTGASRVFGIGAGSWTALSGFRFDRLQLDGCAGTVILDDLSLASFFPPLIVQQCADVRGRDLRCESSLANAQQVDVSASSLQLSSSVISGVDGAEEMDGSDAIRIRNGSLLHLVDSSVVGGAGGPRFAGLGDDAGDGGDAIVSLDDSSVVIVRSTVRGGSFGLDFVSFNDGRSGDGLVACGGQHTVWDSTLEGGSAGGVFGPGNAFVPTCGASLETSTPIPSLIQSGAAAPLTTLNLEAYAQPDSSGRLVFGRFPVRVELPGSKIPRLVDAGRLASLGAMGSQGSLPLQLNLPAWPRGTVVFLQTSATIGANTQMSNGVAILVR